MTKYALMGLLSVALLFAGTALAKGPMNKATGTIWMGSPDQQAIFNAFDAGPNSSSDRGNVEYSNFDYPTENAEVYLHYTAPIICATVDAANQTARFMYQIPEGWPGLSGLYVVSQVGDGGTPGTDGDTYGHTATGDLATATSWCENGASVSNYPITAGNLVVHTY